MPYGLRPLLLKTDCKAEKVQDGKKIEFQLGDIATEAFGFIPDSEMCGRETNFHGGFTEGSMDIGVTWVAKTQYVSSP